MDYWNNGAKYLYKKFLGGSVTNNGWVLLEPLG